MTYVRMTPMNVEPCAREYYTKLTERTVQVIRYKCPICSELCEEGEYFIDEHLLDHAIEDRVNELFEQGRTLKEINDLYHIFDAYVPESYDGFKPCHYNITKDNCFTIPHLACSDLPIYRICHLHRCINIDVYGNSGNWLGYHKQTVGLANLSDPRPLSELFVYKEGR